jgi:hypothetical protein
MSNLTQEIKKYLSKDRPERSPDLELAILLTTEDRVENICTYASKVIGGRWKEAEPIILESGIDAIARYLRDVVKGRWVDAEPIILERGKLEDAMYYAVNVMRCRWIEFEKKLFDNFRQFIDSRDKCDPEDADEMLRRLQWWWKLNMLLEAYILGVIENRWEEAENIIKEAELTVKFSYFEKTGIEIK